MSKRQEQAGKNRRTEEKQEEEENEEFRGGRGVQCGGEKEQLEYQVKIKTLYYTTSRLP